MPRRLLLLLLLLLAAASASSSSGGGDAGALLQFKRAVTFDPAGLLSFWSGPGHCSWPGVACDSFSRVTALNLSSAAAGGGGGGRLSGTLTPALGALSSLRSLNLAGNLFTGPIPRSLSNCKDLIIVNLSQNNLNGTIHDSLISLPNLRRLSLSYNRITGSIPVTIGVRLQHLDLAGNLLVGGIPASLGNCTQLRSLVLQSNLLENSIPTEFGRLTKLRVLDISNNALSGAIPGEIGECKELSVLVLTNDDGDEFNCFQGGLPESVTSLPKLRVLWAPRATVEGEIPGNWGGCESLEMVNLGRNLLTGRIPRVFSECKNLKFLNLSDNKLVGWIDEELPVPCMDLFDVSGNQLSGSIPRFVGSGCAPSSFPIDDLASAYYSSFVYKARVATSLPYFEHGGDYGVYHNFGRNNLTGCPAAEGDPTSGFVAKVNICMVNSFKIYKDRNDIDCQFVPSPLRMHGEKSASANLDLHLKDETMSFRVRLNLMGRHNLPSIHARAWAAIDEYTCGSILEHIMHGVYTDLAIICCKPSV